MKEIMTVDKRERVAQLIDYYQIEDTRSQIKNYLDTYSERIQNKLHPNATALAHEPQSAPARAGGGADSAIYIGEEKGHLGDNVNYTALPRFLSERGHQVIVHKNRYTQDLYANNPYVTAVENRQPEGLEPWGAFTELGWGSAVQRRAFSHGVSLPQTRGEFFIGEDELAQGPKNDSRPLAILHTTGKSVGRAPWRTKHWNALAAELGRLGFFVLQVGGKEDKKLKSCHSHLLKAPIREIITTMAGANFFVGPNSGFMHIAAALEIPSLILLFEVAAAQVQLPVLADNFVLPKQVNDHLFHLYPQNMHAHIGGEGNEWVPDFTDSVLAAAVEGRLFHWDAAVVDYLDLMD